MLVFSVLIVVISLVICVLCLFSVWVLCRVGKLLFWLLLLKKFFRLKVVMCRLFGIVGIVGCLSFGSFSIFLICRCGWFCVFMCMMFCMLCSCMLVCSIGLFGRYVMLVGLWVLLLFFSIRWWCWLLVIICL